MGNQHLRHEELTTLFARFVEAVNLLNVFQRHACAVEEAAMLGRRNDGVE
jgi:hypothetical protein